jgi:hypothetical protein
MHARDAALGTVLTITIIRMSGAKCSRWNVILKIGYSDRSYLFGRYLGAVVPPKAALGTVHITENSVLVSRSSSKNALGA